MKINSDFIYKIFNLKLKLKKESDMIKLSLYEEQIPMYDIYSQKVYPIDKKNIHYRLIDSHYRFINEEVYRWLSNLYKKYKEDKVIGDKFNYNIMVMNNYHIPTLIETSYKTLYKYSPQLGLQVSICKRNSFHPYIYHLKPYYTKQELIKLGQNMELSEFKKNTIDLETLIDMDTHYNVCKLVSSNDVSIEEIISHHQHIISEKMISWVTFYSFTGSFLFNNFLRKNNTPKHPFMQIFYNGMINLVQCIQNAPPLTNDYDIYRFIWDDHFIINMKEGDIFIDTGFLSTTRDPFYSPGLNGNFGLILLKIKLPKNKKGIGLFIENFSLFSKEEEFLLPPNSRLRLLSKNNNFKYYHTNQQFESLINRKYEFELLDCDYNGFFKKYQIKSLNLSNKPHDITKIDINGVDRIDIIRKFLAQYGMGDTKQIHLKCNNSVFSFYYQWFDATDSSSYGNFYYNKIKDGLLLSIFDTNGYMYYNIELGAELVVNYINTIYYHEDNNYEITDGILDIIYHLGRIFYYKDALIFHEYRQFDMFKSNYDIKDHIYLNFSMFNYSIYMYLKNGTKFLSDKQFIEYKPGYWLIDEWANKKPESNIVMLFNENEILKTNKDVILCVVEKYFYLYPKYFSLMDRNIHHNNMVVYNIYDRMVVEGVAETFKPNITYSSDVVIDDEFKLIFRQPIRRI
jgi:hypothetical protein